MRLKTVREAIERILEENPGSMFSPISRRIRKEQCYYALWLISYINVEDPLPAPEIMMTGFESIWVSWKVGNKKLLISITEEGLVDYSTMEDGKRYTFSKQFKRHDLVEIGMIKDYVSGMYE